MLIVIAGSFALTGSVWLIFGVDAVVRDFNLPHVLEVVRGIRPPSTKSFHAGGIIECFQLVSWVIGVALAIRGTMVVRGHTHPHTSPFAGMSAARGLGLLALLGAMAIAREIDLHEWLNPEHAGRWGIRYRSDWWLGDGPIGARALWMGVGATCITALAMLARPWSWRPGRLLASDASARRAAWTASTTHFALMCAGLALGWACDDLLRGKVPHDGGSAFEETFETMGAVFFVLCVLAETGRFSIGRTAPSP